MVFSICFVDFYNVFFVGVSVIFVGRCLNNFRLNFFFSEWICVFIVGWFVDNCLVVCVRLFFLVMVINVWSWYSFMEMGGMFVVLVNMYLFFI